MGFIVLFLALMSQAYADLQLVDPIFSPPNFTSVSRPTCPADNGCFGYNTTSRRLEYWDGVDWLTVSPTNYIELAATETNLDWSQAQTYHKDINSDETFTYSGSQDGDVIIFSLQNTGLLDATITFPVDNFTGGVYTTLIPPTRYVIFTLVRMHGVFFVASSMRGGVPGAGGGTGDVEGPTSAVNGNLAVFDGTTGKKIKDATISSSTLVVKGTNFTEFGRGVVSAGNLMGVTETPYTLPNIIGTSGQVLTTDGAGKSVWGKSGSGDVEGPASSVTNSISLFANTTGKLLKQTPYTLPITDGGVNQVLKTNGSGVMSWADDVDTFSTCTGDVTGPALSAVGNLALYSSTTGKVIAANNLFTADTVNNNMTVGNFSVGSNAGLGGTWACAGNSAFKDSATSYSYCQRQDGRILMNAPTGQSIALSIADVSVFGVGTIGTQLGAQLGGSANPLFRIRSFSNNATDGGTIEFSEANDTQGFRIVHDSLDANSDSLSIRRIDASIASEIARFTSGNSKLKLVGNQSCLEVGADVAKEAQAGKFCYDRLGVGALDITGAGPTVGARTIGLWDNVVTNGTHHISGRLSVGNASTTPDYILPNARGGANQIMVTDANGLITWTDMFLPFNGNFQGRLAAGLGVGDRGKFSLFDTDSSNAATIWAFGNLTSDWDLVLPSTGSPGNNFILEANQWGDLSWIPTPASDISLKKKIQSLKNKNFLKEILDLDIVEFEWNEPLRPEGKRRGLIAQQVQKVIPEGVQERGRGTKTERGFGKPTLDLDSYALIATLAGAIKEQQKQIETLTKEVQALKKGK